MRVTNSASKTITGKILSTSETNRVPTLSDYRRHQQLKAYRTGEKVLVNKGSNSLRMYPGRVFW